MQLDTSTSPVSAPKGRTDCAPGATRASQPVRDLTEARQRRLAIAGLLGLLASFLLFAAAYVPAVYNNLWLDPAFSGWSGPVGHQLLEGRTLYRDLMLPLPPGSFVVMAAIERVLGDGAPRLLHETWVCALAYVAFAAFGYLIARPLTGRRIALFTAGGTLGWVVWTKELAYDPLAEIWAWATVALLVHVWVRESDRPGWRLATAAGLTTGITLLFKQSTATGLLAGALLAFSYLLAVDPMGRWRRVRELAAYGMGSAAGVSICLLAVLLGGGELSRFLEAVFVDGPALKGGTAYLALRTTFAMVAQPMNALSLGTLVLLVVWILRVARHPSGFALGRPDLKEMLGSREVAYIVAASLVVFGGGGLLIALRVEAHGFAFMLTAPAIITITLAGCLAVATFVSNVRASTPEGRAFNAAALMTLVLGTSVSMSMTVLNPGYESNPILAVGLISIFVACRRSRLPRLRWAVLMLAMAAPLWWRVPRAAAATHVVTDDSFFRGMRVNDDGLAIHGVAAEIRELAGPDGTVLVLPEDPSFAALIGRPRPRLCGAIVFPDQYPERCLDHDLGMLRRDPPDVLVVRPARPDQWVPAVRVFRDDPPTERLMTGFFRARFADYDMVAAHPTKFGEAEATLGVWKLR